MPRRDLEDFTCGPALHIHYRTRSWSVCHTYWWVRERRTHVHAGEKYQLEDSSFCRWLTTISEYFPGSTQYCANIGVGSEKSGQYHSDTADIGSGSLNIGPVLLWCGRCWRNISWVGQRHADIQYPAPFSGNLSGLNRLYRPLLGILGRF